jgi:hypothetical protein
MQLISARDPARLPPDPAPLFASFQRIVERVPDDRFHMRGYAWQREDGIFDVAEILYLDTASPPTSAARASVRMNKQKTASDLFAEGRQTSALLTHLTDVVAIDERFADQPNLLSHSGLCDEMDLAPAEEIELFIDASTSRALLWRLSPLEVIQFRVEGSVVTAIGVRDFVVGAYRIASAPS